MTVRAKGEVRWPARRSLPDPYPGFRGRAGGDLQRNGHGRGGPNARRPLPVLSDKGLLRGSGQCRARTCDPVIKSHLLYQLS